MSRNRRKLLGAGPYSAALALVIAMVGGTTETSAADASSPVDRARFVSITRNLEEAPLNPSLKPDRQWALVWLTNAPDVAVHVCASPMVTLVGSKYREAGAIVLQYTFSMAAFVIEHPESATNPDAQQLAGVEGALNAYRSIVREKPAETSPDLESLLATQARGELPDFTRKAFAACLAKK